MGIIPFDASSSRWVPRSMILPFHDQNLVGISDSGQTMGNGQCGAIYGDTL